MTNLVIGLLSALLSSNSPATVSNLIEQTTGVTVTIPDPHDPVEQQYQKILSDDDEAIAKMTGLIKTNESPQTGQGATREALTEQIRALVAPVRQEYESFLRAHPDHARGHVAFGSFLSDIDDEESARTEFETAVRLDPKNAGAWNDLANVLSHFGPVSNMFEFYGRAIDLNPHEPVYYENLATCVYLYRKDALEYYHLTNEQQVFNLSLTLYEQASRYDPTNLALATEVAQSYYGITPVRTDDALKAWTNALALANSDFERESIYVHLARFNLNAGRFAEAHAQIDKVHDSNLAELKNRLLTNLDQQEKEAGREGVPPPPRPICPSGRRW